MTCEEAWVLMSGHLDCENTEAEEAQLREHLEHCPQCRELLQLLQDGDEAIASLQEEPPADLCERVMEVVRKEAPRKRRTWKKWTGLAVAAALVLTIGAANLPQRVEQEPEVMSSRSMERSAVPQVASYAVEAPVLEEDPLQDLAEERFAAIVVMETMPEELHTGEKEELPDGGILYCLDSLQAARDLGEQYGWRVIYPEDGGVPTQAYAYLQP